jgi:peptidoglycan LD-endopeptidase LytH
MRRVRRARRLLRQETLAPWAAMGVILAGWALGAWLLSPAPLFPALARSPEAVETVAAEPNPPDRSPEEVPADAVGSSRQVSPASTGTSGVTGDPPLDVTEDVDVLRSRDLIVPVVGVARQALTQTFTDRRGANRTHEALDIMAPRGTPVVAADNGTIVKLFASKPGGTTIYQFDPSGTYCYYYAHLDRYAPDLTQGDAVERGQTIGYVGSTGNASPDAPHLHFAILRLGPEKRWWEGIPLDPYLVLH